MFDDIIDGEKYVNVVTFGRFDDDEKVIKMDGDLKIGFDNSFEGDKSVFRVYSERYYNEKEIKMKDCMPEVIYLQGVDVEVHDDYEIQDQSPEYNEEMEKLRVQIYQLESTLMDQDSYVDELKSTLKSLERVNQDLIDTNTKLLKKHGYEGEEIAAIQETYKKLHKEIDFLRREIDEYYNPTIDEYDKRVTELQKEKNNNDFNDDTSLLDELRYL